jgi:RNA polymerase sigma-70 factor (ECF subfamily)
MPGDDRTDAELVAAINRGPPGADGAFAALYLRHRDFVLRIARRMTPDDATAADLTQDAFLALADQFPGFELRAKMTTYLYSVVRNRAASLARSRRPMAPIERAALEASSGPQADAEGLAALREAVDRLPESQREVVLMRVVDGMSVGDVAIALGVPTGTVKSRLHAALGALRAESGLRRWFAE